MSVAVVSYNSVKSIARTYNWAMQGVIQSLLLTKVMAIKLTKVPLVHLGTEIHT